VGTPLRQKVISTNLMEACFSIADEEIGVKGESLRVAMRNGVSRSGFNGLAHHNTFRFDGSEPTLLIVL
jgi:hypothetical protein